MSTVVLHTLGCKVNHYGTEAIWQLFKDANYERIEFETNADVFVINICTVTSIGDKKSRQIIRRAIRQNPDAVVCVTGCYAQTSSAGIMEILGVDIVVGTRDRRKLLDYIQRFQDERQPINGVDDIMKSRTYEELKVPYFTDRTRASLRIQEGCNNFCTFCIIPQARGLMRSRDSEEVVGQATQLVNSGYKEIALAGIHAGGYGQDLKNYNLAQLLRDLDTIEGLERTRISSTEASQLADEVIDAIGNSNKVVCYLHIPLQSGSDNVLKHMRRKYTMAHFSERLTKLHQALFDLAVTSDAIVGFPRESEDEFQEAYDFIINHHFSELHVFPYSPRIETPAVRMDNQIGEETKSVRVHRLISLSNQLAKEYASKFEDEVLEVIPEEMGEGPCTLVGYADNYMKVRSERDDSLIGQIVKVKIVKANCPINKDKAIRVVKHTTNQSEKEVLV